MTIRHSSFVHSSFSLKRLIVAAAFTLPTFVATSPIMRFVQLLLLLWGQQRAELRHCFVHHRFHLLRRLLVDGGYFRFRLVKDRLNPCFLLRRQIQLLGHSLQSFVSSAAAALMPFLAIGVLILGERSAAKRKRADTYECD